MKQVDNNGFWSIKNNPISKVGVFPYLGKQIDPTLEPDKVYMVLRPAEELFNQETLDSFNENPVPLVDDHTMIGDEYTPPEQKGIDGVVQNIRQEGDRLVGDISIYSKAMKDKISQGKKDLSMGYFCTYDIEDGEYNGEHYDAIQRNIRSNHVALVDRGRCGHDVRVFDRWCFDCIAEDLISFRPHLYEVDFDESPADHNAKIAERQDPIFKDWINTVFRENKIRKFDYNQATGEVKVQIDATNRTKENPHSDVIEITLEKSRKTAQDCDFQFIGQRIIEDAEFVESEHPRKKDGKFAKKGEGEAAGGRSESKEKKITVPSSNRKAIVERARNVGEQNRSLVNNKERSKAYESFLDKENKFINYEMESAIKDYTGEDYKNINGYLRKTKRLHGEALELAEHNVAVLTEVCKHQFSYDQVLYRGTGIQEVNKMLSPVMRKKIKEEGTAELDELKQDLIGKVYEAKGFTSTTTAEHGLFGNVEFKIIAPAGTHGVDLTYLSAQQEGLDGEQEVLLQRGTKFEITNVNIIGHGELQIEMSVVTPEEYQIPKFNKEDLLQEIKEKKEKNARILDRLKETVGYSLEDNKDHAHDFISAMAASKLLAESVGKMDAQNFNELRKSSWSEILDAEESFRDAKDFLKDYAESLFTINKTKKDDINKKIIEAEKAFNDNPQKLDNLLKGYEIVSEFNHYVDADNIRNIEEDIFNKLGISRKDFDDEYKNWRDRYAI